MERNNEQTEALIRLAAALDSVGVSYMLTGSLAASFYVEPRMTRDIDVVIDPRPNEWAALIKVLSEDFDVDPDMISEARRDRTMFNLLAPGSLVKIDVIPRNRMMNSDEVFARRQVHDVAGNQVMMISREDLIIAKLMWARESRSEMQLRDVHRLLGASGLDGAYVGERARREGLAEMLEEARDARYD